MRKLTILLCVMLILSHVLTEASTLLYLFFPEIDQIKVNPWLDKNYVFYGDPAGINLKWFIKYMTDDILLTVTFFVVAKVSYQYSYRLFLVGSTFFIYHLIDTFMLWYNYKTSDWIYWLLNAIICTSIVWLFIPERKQGMLKSME